jgi:hypothetical protein
MGKAVDHAFVQGVDHGRSNAVGSAALRGEEAPAAGSPFMVGGKYGVQLLP